MVDELSGQVDVEQLKHSPSADSLGLRDGETTDGGGKPSTVKIESDFGRLVVDERKSAYVASPFWAKVSQEVRDRTFAALSEAGGLDLGFPILYCSPGVKRNPPFSEREIAFTIVK